ncbi:MAG: anion permease [Bacteroidales bacterium]|nr:anion permease [Bacteroidales bacterium]
MYAQESGVHIPFFATTVPGLACLAVGILSMLAMRRLLPVRKSPDEDFSQTGEYTVELLVPADHPQIGNTLQETGLYDTPHGKLVELIRFDREILSPVKPDEPLMGGDRLVYSGLIEELLQIRDRFGLVNADHPVFTVDELDKHRQLRTAYIMPGCELIGQTVSATHFERDHRITLVAAARQGQRITKSPRDIQLQVGDSLLLECTNGAADTKIRGLQFFDSQEIVQHGPKTLVSALILLAMILLSSLNIISLLQSAALAAIAMLVFRCCSPGQAVKAIDWGILMVFAGSVVIGKAIETTGIAATLAQGVMHLCNGKPLLVMSMMCLTATFVTEFVSNTAAGAIFFPIVYHSAVSMGCDPLPFLISLMIAVSSSFATPIGSPTHLLVYGPGGYRFTDFLKTGLPMNLIILITNLLIVNLIYPVLPCWRCESVFLYI